MQKAGQVLSLGGGGTAVISEAELLEVLADVRPRFEGRWVFGAEKHGQGLTFFHDTSSAHAEAEVARVHQALCARNEAYGRSVAVGTLSPIGLEQVPADAAILKHQTHAQAKQRVLACELPASPRP